MDVSGFLRNRLLRTSGVAIISPVITFAVGIGSGYILGRRKEAKKHLSETSEQLALFNQDGISQVMTVVSTVERDYIGFVQPIEVNLCLSEEDQTTDEADAEVYDPGGNDEDEAEALAEEIKKVNVFTLPDDWDMEAELSSRDPSGPYIIHVEEFVADEMGYRQETLTYYSGDDIMTDTTDTPIYGYTNMMGDLSFGHGSKDKNVVYIRNETLHMEWEVLLHQGMYSREVLGLEMDRTTEKDMYHSIQKFRRE